MLIKIFFLIIKQSVNPRKQIFCTMICVHENCYSICLCQMMNMLSTGYASQNCCSLTCIIQTFACIKSTTTIAELYHYRRVDKLSCLKHCIDGVCSNYIDCWKRIIIFICMVEKISDFLSVQNAWPE